MKRVYTDFYGAAVVELGGVHDGQGTVWPWAFLAMERALSLLSTEGEVGETAELGIRVHLQYLKVYTRRSKCFIHIGFLNKAIGDLKKALKLVSSLCNRLIEDNAAYWWV